MSYQHERDEFLVAATREGLDLATCRKLLRYATTLQRLAEAQCNGDWPYNGDRDRPYDAKNQLSDAELNRQRRVWDSRYTVCPKCEASGVAMSAMRYSAESHCGPDHALRCPHELATPHHDRVCPDCRTQELVRALLLANDPGCTCGNEDKYRAIFQGDPRGAVLLLATPNYPWSEDGRGRGIVVPARGTR